MNKHWPFKKITGKNGELYHLNNKPFMVKVHPNIEIAIDDIVEFINEDKRGNLLTQLGKVLNIFFLESTQAIIAQVEREPDKKVIALEIDKIKRNLNQTADFVSTGLSA